MTLNEYPDFEMLAIDLANKLAGELTAALDHSERVLMAVPGGTTPGPIFDDLCAADLDWSRVDVMLTDERWVPESSERSNTRLLRERLLVNRAAAATLVPMYLPASEPEEQLDALRHNLRGRLPIDVLVLGMGADMHTASLFPGADQLEAGLASDAPEVLAMRAPGAPEPRVTLTAPVLDGALRKHLVIRGDEKRAALETARRLPATDAPVHAVLSGMQVHWSP
ncbi:6-phosphogluconolactonase [Roseobacteraceae bacterium S113]